MSNDFDRVFKEVFPKVLPGILQLKYGLQAIPDSDLPLAFNGTYERRVDHLSKAVDKQGNEWIIHIAPKAFGVQTRQDHEMIYRMQRYHAEILLEHRLPIRHIVLLARGRSNMKTQLRDNEVFRGYELINLSELSVDFFRESETPGIILMGVLANFGKASKESVISDLVERIVEYSQTDAEASRHLEQLMIFSRINKLTPIVNQKIDAMPFNFDLKVDEEYFTKLGEIKMLVKIYLNKLISVENAASQLEISVEKFEEYVHQYADHAL